MHVLIFWIHSGEYYKNGRVCNKDSVFQYFHPYFLHTFPHFTLFSYVEQIKNFSFEVHSMAFGIVL